MASDRQFTAHGRAIVGFQTNGARIERGADVAGTEVGLVAAGPTGIRARGDDFGARIHGTHTAIEGVGHKGRGAVFGSPVGPAQVRLVPQGLGIVRGRLEPSTPNQVSGVVDLPRVASTGDLLMTTFGSTSGPNDTRSAALWMCVGHRGSGAVWREVLLGGPIVGTVPPPA